MTAFATLTGTDKQVAWAADIRTTLLARIDAEVAHHTQSWAGEEMPAHVVALMDRYASLRGQIAAETEATALIDARFIKLDEAVSKSAPVRQMALARTPWSV